MLASCSNEEVMSPASDGPVVFTVSLPGEFTRAISDGTKAEKLSYAVYLKGQSDVLFTSQTATDPQADNFSGLKTTLSLDLAKGKTYDIIFWADVPGNSYYTFTPATKSVTMDYTAPVGNDEYRDAFFQHVELEVKGASTQTVELRRPFAQLNFATSDFAAAKKAGLNYGGSKVVVKNVYNTLNLLDGKASGAAEVTFNYADLVENETTTHPGTTDASKKYNWLSMNYLLTGAVVPDATNVQKADNEVVDVEFQVYAPGATEGVAGDLINTVNVANVPVQRNYRTNIYGALLTSTVDINVNKDPNFGDNINVPADTVEYTPDTDLSQGGDIKISATLTDDITIPADLTQPLNLYVNAAVPTITMPMSNNAKAIKIVVAKDVAYPEVKFPMGAEIDGFSLVGDPASTELAKGFIFMVGSSSIADCPKTLKNFTLDGVNFDGAGFKPQYSVTTENVVIRNCSFLNCKDNAIGVQHVGGGSGQTATNYTIENCKVTFAADVPANTNGLYLLDIQGTLIVKNTTIENAPYHGITISGNPYNSNVARASKIEITGNTITGSGSKDGIKIDGEIEAELIVTGNHVKVSENGIRIKNSLDSNNLTITGNTVDCECAIEFSNGEPWGILIINKTVAQSAVITGTEADNTFINSKGHNFSIEGVTAETN